MFNNRFEKRNDELIFTFSLRLDFRQCFDLRQCFRLCMTFQED